MTAPYVPQKQSILDRLMGRLFPTSALLDPESQQLVQRQARTQLGANLLAGGGASPMQRGTLANIGAALGGVDVNALTRNALALQEYQRQAADQRRIQDVIAANPAQPNETSDQLHDRALKLIGELSGIPGSDQLVARLTAAANATKSPETKWSFQTIMENGHPVLYRINEATGDKYRVGLGKEEAGAGSLNATQKAKFGENAEFGAAALAAWRPVEQIRNKNPGVEAEVGGIMTSPAFVQAIPGFHSADQAVLALKKAGASDAAQAYLRAKISFLAQIERTRFTGARGITGQLLQQFYSEFMPGLDELGNAQMRQNEIQAMLTAQGNAGIDVDPSFWQRAAKRHGVSGVDLENLLSGGSLDSRQDEIAKRYPNIQ